MPQYKLQFEDATHTYTLDGEVIPSVTHIVRFLDADVDKSRPWLRDEAAERGTLVHDLCAMLDYGEDISEETPPYIQGYITAYMNFLRDCNCDWRYIERCDWAEFGGVRYAGTLDRFGKVNGVNTIVDIKTGTSGSRHRHAAQLTGYSFFPCVSEAQALAVLYLHRDGTYKFQVISADEPLWSACCLMQSRIGGKCKK